MVKISCKIFILSLCFYCSLFCITEPVNFKGLKYDRDLENAYMTLFSKEFGYTLLGEKPMCIEDGIENEYLARNPQLLQLFFFSLQETFKNSKKFIFKVFLEEDQFYWIELIHKTAIRNCVLQHQKLRRFIQKKFGNEGAFYKALEDPKIKITDILEGDAYLKGIVLGYGDSNAQYFCRRCIVRRYFNEPSRVILPFSIENRPEIFPSVSRMQIRQYAMIKPEPSPGFPSLEAEREWVEKVEWNLEKEREATPPYFVALPLYICRHGGDSETVREKYKRASVKLARLFSGKSFRQTVTEEAQKP